MRSLCEIGGEGGRGIVWAGYVEVVSEAQPLLRRTGRPAPMDQGDGLKRSQSEQ